MYMNYSIFNHACVRLIYLQMVWIEMSKDEKLKGKAAVDLLGSQVSLTEDRHFLPLSPSVSG